MGSWRRLGEPSSRWWSPCEGEREDVRLQHCSKEVVARPTESPQAKMPYRGVLCLSEMGLPSYSCHDSHWEQSRRNGSWSEHRDGSQSTVTAALVNYPACSRRSGRSIFTAATPSHRDRPLWSQRARLSYWWNVGAYLTQTERGIILILIFKIEGVGLTSLESELTVSNILKNNIEIFVSTLKLYSQISTARNKYFKTLKSISIYKYLTYMLYIFTYWKEIFFQY